MRRMPRAMRWWLEKNQPKTTPLDRPIFLNHTTPMTTPLYRITHHADAHRPPRFVLQAAGHSAPPPEVHSLHMANDADVSAIDLAGVERITLHFPQFTDGRAYSQAVLLRKRLGFAGDLRASGDLGIDQLLQLARSGFSSVQPDAPLDLAAGQRQLDRYAAFYQGDAVQPHPLFAESRA